MALLRFITGELQGEVIELPRARVTFGRDIDNMIGTDNPAVSLHHAVIIPEAGGFVIYDLDSSNGTFVNGEKIKERRLLNGDMVKIGIMEMRYELEGVPPEKVHHAMRIDLPPV